MKAFTATIGAASKDMKQTPSAAGSAKEAVTPIERSVQEVSVIAEAIETASLFVKTLADQSEKVRDIVTAINEIADQTNLIALNAAIEAVRAGEHGKKFAVIAEEVKRVAEKADSSSMEAGKMIHTIRQHASLTVNCLKEVQQHVLSGTRHSFQAQAAVQDITTTIDDLNGDIQRIAAAIERSSG